MKKTNKLIAVATFFFLLILPALLPVQARLGVGVTTGKIEVDERLMSGTIYKLPTFVVVNTGDEASQYEVSIAHRDNQDELVPELEWFSFEPQSFYLEPGETQAIDVELSLPIETIPGDYFCFIEGHPVLDEEGGGAQIGISAATKLYFTIAPSNLFEGIYYRVISLWIKYLPWTNIGAAVVVSIILILILRKFIKIDVKLNKPSVEKGEGEGTNNNT